MISDHLPIDRRCRRIEIDKQSQRRTIMPKSQPFIVGRLKSNGSIVSKGAGK